MEKENDLRELDDKIILLKKIFWYVAGDSGA